MKRRSPTLEGFKVMFRRPSLGLAEIAWRWSFGGAACGLLLLSFLEYLNTLPVSRGDMFLLRTRQPGLISRALSHILAGSGPRFVAAFVVLALTLGFAWVVVASVGRAATVRGLLGYFWRGEAERTFPFRFSAMVRLNFLRAGAMLAVLVASMGAMVLGGMASSEKNPSPGAAFLVFLAVAGLAWLAWGTVNWVLSLAGVFVVSGNRDALGAIADAVGLVRERSGAVFAASTWFGLGHIVLFFVASSVVGFPLALAGVLPRGVVLGGVLVVTLVYFAAADLLYLGRLGAYVWIVEGAGIEPEIVVLPPVIPPGTPSEHVDPDELILSDLPVS
jgi:hypothetical protein